MSFYEHKADKKSGDGLALTEWNDLSNAVAGNSGLTLAMTATDKIGIGTLDPKQKLHVKDGGLLLDNSSLRIESAHNNVTPDIGTFLAKNLTQGIGIGYDRIEAIGSNASQHILLKPKGNGNVGIGATSSPEEKLHVSGNVKATKFIGDGSQLTNLSVGLTGLNLATTTGNVGIGTTSPEFKLDVNGRIRSGGTAGGMWVDSDNKKFMGAEGTKIGFYNNGAWRLQADDNGNVGIGTSTPDARLNIIDAPSDAQGKTLILGPTNGTNLRLGYHTNYSWIQSHGLKPLSINPVGNSVGIGTTTPSDTLEVNGTLRLSGAGNYCQMYLGSRNLIFGLKTSRLGANRTTSWDGDGNWDVSSDISLKTNIVNEQNILSRLMKLDVKNYNWKDEPERETKMIGFVAQDVKPLFPALVGEIEDPESKQISMTLKYANFSVLAIGAIKELKLEYDKRIAALEAEVAGLKKKWNA